MDSRVVFRLMCLVCVGTQIVPGTNAAFLKLSTPNGSEDVRYISTSATANALAKKSFVFSVKACNDAFVHLTDGLNADLKNKLHYQLVIGGWKNKVTDLREKNKCQAGYGCKYDDPSVARTKHSTGPLDCNAFKPFWVSWKNGISVGTGNVVGKETFLKWAGPMKPKFTLRNIAVSTGFGSTGEWIIPQGYIEMSTTQGIDDVKFVAQPSVMVAYRASKAIVFSVKACKDAFIHLTKTTNRADLKTALHYQLVIGGWSNTKTDLREKNKCQAGFGCKYDDPSVKRVTNSHRPLDCSASKPFWVSWAGNGIQVGYGTVVGRDTFLTWAGPLRQTINYVGISTSKRGFPGAWTLLY